MNKIGTKKTSAIFLAFVLVTGTIAAISPSFIVKGVNAQGDPYNGMYDRYDDRKSYGIDDSYGYSDYLDHIYKKAYDDSYGYSEYGKDSIYDDRKSYDMRSYGNDNIYDRSQYQTVYEPDYKPEYQSYDEKDDRDKFSKDSKKSVSINKLKCINTNLNINGNNTGDVSIGNKGQGHLGTYSSADGGYNDDDGYSNGYKMQKDDGFVCIINNNNNNTNIAAGGDVDVTEPQPPIDADCTAGVACIVAALDPTMLGNFKVQIGLPSDAPNEDMCEVLDDLTAVQVIAAITAPVVGGSDALAIAILNCLIDAGFTNLE